MSSPEEPPKNPTATNGDPAPERGVPEPAAGRGAANADADTDADADRADRDQPGTSGPAGAGDLSGQPDPTAQPTPVDRSETSDQPDADQAGDSAGQQGTGQPSASAQPSGTPGQTPPTGDQQGSTQPGASSEQAGAGGEPEIPELSPIPPGGTAAPADTQRVFGRTGGQPLGGAPTPAGPGVGWQRSTAQTTSSVEPTEADLKKIRSLGRWALTFGIIGLLAILLPPISLILGIAAIVVGIMARRLARRNSMVSPGAVPGIVLGIVSTMITAVIGVTLATFWTESRTYMTCVEGANTHSARAKCEDEFRKSLEKRGLVTERQ